MKLTMRILSLLFIMAALGLAACKSKSTPAPSTPESEKVAIILKSKAWNLQSTTIDGIATNDFKNMTLMFTTSNYTTTNGGVVWPATGTWSFTSTAGKSFKRDDGVEVLIESITETSLTLSLQWSKTTLGTGRVGSTAGKHVFSFIR